MQLRKTPATSSVMNSLLLLCTVVGWLAVTAPSAAQIPPNDPCAAASPIGDVSNQPFNTAQATFDGGGTCLYSANLWYCYTASCTGTATISLCGSTYDTMLAVYRGCSCTPLGTELGCIDDSCGLGSELSIQVIAGSRYMIEVGGYGGGVGPGILSISCAADPVGACCDSEGCEVTAEFACEQYGGVYFGAGTTCSPADCNTNGIPDTCDLIAQVSYDCNSNGVPDECEPIADTDTDGVTDVCDNCPFHPNRDQSDCDRDGMGDACALAQGRSVDCNGNGTPDECEMLGVYAGTQSAGIAGLAKVYRHAQGAQWIDLTPDGLGQAVAVMDLATSGDVLYAGVQTQPGQGGSFGEGQVWRFEGGTAWRQVGTLDNSVMVLQAYNGQVFAGTNAGSLYRCTNCQGSDWQQIPGGGGTGFRAGIVASICGQPELYLGELNTDAFWRYTAQTGLVALEDHGGSCIWDFAELDGALYAGAWAGYGPVYRTVGNVDCNYPRFQLLDSTGENNWAMATFRDQVYIGSGGSPGPSGGNLWRYDGSVWSVLHSWPSRLPAEGVSALAVEGGESLYIGLGMPDGYYQGDGRAEVWRFDGQTYEQISPDDYFGGGVQCLLVTTGGQDCNTNGALDDCDIASGVSRDVNANGIPDECEPSCVIPPIIGIHPLSQSLCEGADATLRIAAVGIPSPAYLWRKNGVGIPGADQDTYTITSTTVQDSATYDVVLSNTCGLIVSDAAVLTIWPLGTADTNGDGLTDGLDIRDFVETLLQGPNCGPDLACCASDGNGDGAVSMADIPFFNRLLLR